MRKLLLVLLMMSVWATVVFGATDTTGCFTNRNDAGSSIWATNINYGCGASNDGDIHTITLMLNADETNVDATFGVFTYIATDSFACTAAEAMKTTITGSAGDTITLTAPTDFDTLAILTGQFLGMYSEDLNTSTTTGNNGTGVRMAESNNLCSVGDTSYYDNTNDVDDNYNFIGIIDYGAAEGTTKLILR